jgi:hypothetical protein
MSRRSAIVYMGSIGAGIAANAAVGGTISSEGSHDVVNKSEPARRSSRRSSERAECSKTKKWPARSVSSCLPSAPS